MKAILLDGKPSYIIKAIKKSTIYQSMKSTLYDCEGDEVWIPNSLCKYNPEKCTLIVHKWFYDKLVRDGKL